MTFIWQAAKEEMVSNQKKKKKSREDNIEKGLQDVPLMIGSR